MEIERTMKAMEGKLDDWGWLSPEMDHMVEQIEKYGGLEFSS